MMAFSGQKTHGRCPIPAMSNVKSERSGGALITKDLQRMALWMTLIVFSYGGAGHEGSLFLEAEGVGAAGAVPPKTRCEFL